MPTSQIPAGVVDGSSTRSGRMRAETLIPSVPKEPYPEAAAPVSALPSIDAETARDRFPRFGEFQKSPLGGPDHACSSDAPLPVEPAVRPLSFRSRGIA